MGFWDWVIVFVAIVLGLGILAGIGEIKREKRLEEKLAALKDFTPTQKIMETEGRYGVAIDERRNKLCLIDAQYAKDIILDVLPYKDLLAVEIFEDGSTVTRTSRTSQIGGALIGGLALGGVGAIIGGLSGKTISSGKVKRVDLRLTVNRTDSPCHNVNILNEEVKKTSSKYSRAIEKARRWHSILRVAIHRADEEDRSRERFSATNDGDVTEKTSVADELRKLVDLKTEGVLSDEEFAAQKARLLS